MCYAIFVATDHPLPTIEWDESNPAFYLTELEEHEKIVKEKFTKQNIAYAGSHEGCSCGFFYDITDEDDEKEELDASVKSAQELINFLNSALKKESTVEMFVCWEGDWSEEPLRKINLTPQDLEGESFPLEEKDFIVFTNQPNG